jgi:hypothetical protein
MWVALVLLGFILWWPLGLALLACLLWSGAMGCCGFGNGRAVTSPPLQEWRAPRARGSGSEAFDDYRTATLRRLEEEQREFHAFLAQLRMAKDKAEFDQFMAERRSRGTPPPEQG